MSKAPPNTPERGDRVRLRGKDFGEGVLKKFDPETNWSTVEWDEDGPKVCHRFELERVPKEEK